MTFEEAGQPTCRVGSSYRSPDGCRRGQAKAKQVKVARRLSSRRRGWPALLAFATVLTGQRATAEDVTQEVLIRAHGRWDQIAHLDRPELYVRKMVLNEFLSGTPWSAACCRAMARSLQRWQLFQRWQLRYSESGTLAATCPWFRLRAIRRSCSSSVQTGRAIRTLWRSRSLASVLWSNSSGDVLVVQAAATRNGRHMIIGVLQGSRLTPIPGVPEVIDHPGQVVAGVPVPALAF
jgi:hypothetical protein